MKELVEPNWFIRYYLMSQAVNSGFADPLYTQFDSNLGCYMVTQDSIGHFVAIKC